MFFTLIFDLDGINTWELISGDSNVYEKFLHHDGFSLLYYLVINELYANT